MLSVPKPRSGGPYLAGDLLQPGSNGARLGEASHMSIARRKIAIRRRETGILLDCDEQFRHRLIKAPSQEMRLAYQRKRGANAGARTETQRGLGMLDREVGLAGEKPENAADVPPAGKIRVERQGMIDQSNHCVDILAEIGQGEGGIDNDVRVVTGDF